MLVPFAQNTRETLHAIKRQFCKTLYMGYMIGLIHIFYVKHLQKITSLFLLDKIQLSHKMVNRHLPNMSVRDHGLALTDTI